MQVELLPQYPGTLGIELKERLDGVEISGFSPMCNRDGAPLLAGDRIIAVDGQAVRKSQDLDRRKRFAGQEVELTLERNGEKRTADIICARASRSDPSA